jgi:hypothetical protein
VLYSYKAAGLDEQKLPGFVTAVTTNLPFTGVSGKTARPNFASCSTDRRALEPLASAGSTQADLPPNGVSTVSTVAKARDGSGVSGCRALGGLLGGTVATIDILGDGAHNISLYLVDWERQGRRVAVELREYDNLQLAAPTQQVANYTEGVWMTWEMRLPARLRLFQVAGPLPNNNALLVFSALTFDGGAAK